MAQVLWPGGARYLVLATTHTIARSLIEDFSLNWKECLVVSPSCPQKLWGRRFYPEQILWAQPKYTFETPFQIDVKHATIKPEWEINQSHPHSADLTDMKVPYRFAELIGEVIPNDWRLEWTPSHATYGFSLLARCPHDERHDGVITMDNLLAPLHLAVEALRRLLRKWTYDCKLHQLSSNPYWSDAEYYQKSQATFSAEAFQKAYKEALEAPIQPQAPMAVHPSLYHALKKEAAKKYPQPVGDPPTDWNSVQIEETQSSWHGVITELAKVFPAILREKVKCPADYCSEHGQGNPDSDTIASLVPHLNDHHKWSRERIADWLDRLPVDLTLQPTSQGD